MKSLSLCLLVIIAFNVMIKAQCTLPAPATLTVSDIGSCQLTLTWSSVPGAHHYQVKYQVSGASTFTTINLQGTGTTYTITGLASETTYLTKVAGACANNLPGTFKSVSKKTTKCSTPINIVFSDIEPSKAKVSWTALCGTSIIKLQYKLHTASLWTTISNVNAPNYTLTNLLQATPYDVRVAAVCGSTTAAYTATASFTTTVPTPPAVLGIGSKNVLIILIDDARQSSFAPEGGPAFFLNPNISSLAYEGARFALCLPAEAQCAPSRSSLLTGLYPHKTGVLNNSTLITTLQQISLPQILHSRDYFTGYIGKYHLAGIGTTIPQPGYDYWMENTTVDYVDQPWNVNGTIKTVTGHKTDVVTDSSIGFLHKIPPGKSFFLEMAFAAPHLPYSQARTQDNQLYTREQMPLAGNPDFYSENYPSVLYPCQQSNANMTSTIRGYYQLLAGLEYSVGRILTELQNLNVLDSTLIIFTSDNGYMMGDHHLTEKRMAYEECLRLPLYMRYPPAIEKGTVVENDIAMIIDLAPTVLDYLDIPNTYSMDGISLKKMIEGTIHRKESFHEFFAQDCMPDIRAVRSLDYKYIQYGCDSITEEFFDVANDPGEKTNLLYTESYGALIQQYRLKLDSLKNSYNYSGATAAYNCHLLNPVHFRNEDGENIATVASCHAYPNPASDHMTVSAIFTSDTESTSVQVQNMLGEVMNEMKVENSEGRVEFDLNTSGLFPGIYVLSLKTGGQIVTMPFVVQRN